MRIRITFFIVILLTVFSIAEAQKPPKKVTISGTVTDASQKAVAGALIIVDNKKTDRVTDAKGKYKIKVKTDAKQLTVFSMQMGMLDEQIDGRTIIDFRFVLKNNSQASGQIQGQNEETVNVGYGSLKKSEMTTTVGQIDGQNKKYASYTNIYDMIRGEVPGVQVTGRTIVIQGPQSINLSSDPLFVVDGMIVTSIDDIRPQQVKSIEILKGPSASIYGSRGANGVIMITLIGVEKKK